MHTHTVYRAHKEIFTKRIKGSGRLLVVGNWHRGACNSSCHVIGRLLISATFSPSITLATTISLFTFLAPRFLPQLPHVTPRFASSSGRRLNANRVAIVVVFVGCCLGSSSSYLLLLIIVLVVEADFFLFLLNLATICFVSNSDFESLSETLAVVGSEMCKE